MKKPTRVPLIDAPGMYRDVESGMIINTNEAEYQAILEQRKQKAEIDDLKGEIDELKQIVKALLK